MAIPNHRYGTIHFVCHSQRVPVQIVFLNLSHNHLCQLRRIRRRRQNPATRLGYSGCNRSLLLLRYPFAFVARTFLLLGFALGILPIDRLSGERPHSFDCHRHHLFPFAKNRPKSPDHESWQRIMESFTPSCNWITTEASRHQLTLLSQIGTTIFNKASAWRRQVERRSKPPEWTTASWRPCSVSFSIHESDPGKPAARLVVEPSGIPLSMLPYVPVSTRTPLRRRDTASTLDSRPA